MDWKPVAAVLYLALVTTALTTWLQAIGQRTVPAAQAALLYTQNLPGIPVESRRRKRCGG
jgi:hypothetical protein